MSRAKNRLIGVSFLVTLFNLLICISVFWYSPHSTYNSSPIESRLLLSLEYPGESGPASDPTEIVQTPNFKESGISSVPQEKVPSSDSIKTGPPSDPTNIGFYSLSSLDTSQGMLDSSRQFKSHMFWITGKSWSQLSSKANLCLGTQTSVDRLDKLVELLDTWPGPVSVSIFTPHTELTVAVKYISYLRSCWPSVANQVSFHITYPVDHVGREDQVDVILDCDSPNQVLQSLLDTVRTPHMMTWRESYPYPQNLLRNLAKKGCQTNYTYIPDIDMVAGYPNMYDEVEKFLTKQDNCTKCAYVIPTYEISDSVSHLPINKTELLEMVSNKQARQFHQALYSINQKSSDLNRWQKIPQSSMMEVVYKVEKYIFKYEPLYVAKADTPMFDERFQGFGMTRNTQVYEMYVAGYNFYLLNNAFTSHRGFQSLKSRPEWRARQQEENNAKFDEFAKEISAHYSADPYNMLDQLKKMNLKHVKVAYGVKNGKKAKIEDSKNYREKTNENEKVER